MFDYVSQSVSVVQSDMHPTNYQEVMGSIPRREWQHSFMGIDHEIFSAVILSLLLIEEGQLSVSGKRMCTNCLEAQEKVWSVKLTSSTGP